MSPPPLLTIIRGPDVVCVPYLNADQIRSSFHSLISGQYDFLIKSVPPVNYLLVFDSHPVHSSKIPIIYGAMSEI